MLQCSKPACGAPAAVILAYSYADRVVDLQDADGSRAHAQTYALCLRCADALQPPRGWTLRDRRSRPPLFARPVVESESRRTSPF